MPLDVVAARAQLVNQIRKAPRSPTPSDPASYLGSPVPVLGLRIPTLRAILSSFALAHRDLTASEVNALAAALWSGDVFEEKAVGIMLLDRFAKMLDGGSWALADRWVDEATGWALSDALASGPIAKMVRGDRSRYTEVLRWTRSTNIWRRRASTYAMHDLVFAGELDRPFRILEKLLYDDQFWVQRAVGTWLRECWKQDRPRTEAFLRKHIRGLPRVVITVATERAPKALRAELRRRR
jgi:3-methyladenine DNA glycosylase AlkD